MYDSLVEEPRGRARRPGRAEQQVLTRPLPKSTQARVRFLVKQLKTPRAVAELLGVSQRSGERYLTGERKSPPKPIAVRIEGEVRRRWQPRVRQRARQQAATATGIAVETGAQFGFTAAPGSTHDPRLRRITEHLPPDYTARFFDAHAAGATERQPEAIVAEGLQEMYFKDRGRRARGLIVDLTGIDYIELDYR
ncbi:telomere-protecting terminal protein Tpg [Streptomyces sp. KR80]|uniref:telomere-protecting terminal protein Tpg n=1 Tax=Streptomyces sp. KR80 TaxID=3457426 RepID=UPI003FD2E0F0